MSNFDLESIWEEEPSEAAAYYERIASELQKVVRKRSQHVLQKLRRTIILEWVSSLVFLGVFLLICYDLPFFKSLLVWCGITLGLVVYPYWKMWQKVKAIPTKSIHKSLEAYLEVVRLFMLRIKWLYLLLSPIGVLLGMFFAIQEEGTPMALSEIFVMVLGGLAIGLFIYLPIKYWYLPFFYGRTVTELETLLQQLEVEN